MSNDFGGLYDLSTKKAAVTKVKTKTMCQFQVMRLSYFVNTCMYIL